MEILKQYQIKDKILLVALIENPSVSAISKEAKDMKTRLATNEELTELHTQLWQDEHGTECEIEHTLALGNTNHSGSYAFVAGGVFDCVLTKITEDRIQIGHKVLLVKSSPVVFSESGSIHFDGKHFQSWPRP